MGISMKEACQTGVLKGLAQPALIWTLSLST